MLSVCELAPNDYMLNHSTIGNEHGDIFASLLEQCQQSELNYGVPTYYEQYMKPLIQSNGDGGKFKL